MEGEKKGTFDGRMGDFRHDAVEGTTNAGASAQCAKERNLLIDEARQRVEETSDRSGGGLL